MEKSHNSVLVSADGRKIYIYMLKRESGGSYEVTWVIQDKKYLRRVVDFGFLKIRVTNSFYLILPGSIVYWYVLPAGDCA